MRKFILLFGISILITLLFGLKRGVEISPYPNTLTDGSSENIQMVFPRVEGGGFPLMWWRRWPGLNPGEIHMTSMIRGGVGFVIDVVFWYGVAWFLYWVVKRVDSKKFKNKKSTMCL